MEKFDITNFELYDSVLNGDAEEKDTLLKSNFVLKGWVRTNRSNGQIGFIEFNDGTYFNQYIPDVHLQHNMHWLQF